MKKRKTKVKNPKKSSVPVNKHGLERTIPTNVKLEVRQRCGFGCVVCGNGFFQYDHFDPPFSECIEHNADGITLLCGGCHDRKTRGHLSLETLRISNSNPKAKQLGFSFGPFDIGAFCPSVILGTLYIHNTQSIIKFDNNYLLKVEPPQFTGGPFLFSALLKDLNGKKIFEVEQNEWKLLNHNWDSEVIGDTFTIRSKKYNIDLRLKVAPPHTIVVERLKMFHKGFKIECNDNIFSITTPDKKIFKWSLITIQNSDSAIEINSNGRILVGRGGEIYIQNLTIQQNL